MRPINELVQYLDAYLAPKMWTAGANLIENVAVSRAAYQVRKPIPSVMRGLLKTSVSFDRLPRVTARSANEIGIRLPGDGRHVLKTDVDFWNPIPDPTIKGEILVEVAAGTGPANVQVDVNTTLDWVSDFVFILAGGSIWIKRLFEGIAENIISQVLEGALKDQVGGLEAYRFDRTGDLQWPSGAAGRIELLRPSSGSNEPKASGYVDVLLVADGFDGGNIAEFNDLAATVARLFADTLNLPRPFLNFMTALRIWKMPLIVNDPTDLLQLATVPFQDRGNAKMTFSNLARVAEIGLTAHETFGRHPILVFCSRTGVEARANAPGPFVLLRYAPPNPGSNPAARFATAAAILVHELGHTPLGRMLADEYSGGGLGRDKEKNGKKQEEEENDFYRGPEPEARNVSIGGPLALMKWQAWITPGSRSLGVEGAYEHDRGIYRFQEDCRMRIDTLGDFCPICREQLMLGMLDWGHYAAGVRGVSGMVDLQVDYVRPWTETISLHLVGGENSDLQVFVGSPTLVRLAVSGSSAPKPWHSRWRITDIGASLAVREATGESVEIWIKPNTKVELFLVHDVANGGILSTQFPAPSTHVSLNFNQERRARTADLSPPTDLIQSLPVGGMIRPVIKPADGSVSYPEELWVAARLGEVRNYSLQTTVEFLLDGPGNFSLSQISAPGVRNERRRWRVERIVPAGRYVWSARTRWDSVSGQYSVSGPPVGAQRSQEGICFEIGLVRFEPEPKPPVNPFDLIVDEFVGRPGVPRGLAASSWHPNDKTIRFQFEIKPYDEAWTERNLIMTDYFERDLSRLDSVAITGRIPIDISVALFSTLVKWRVRAEDPDNRKSEWVEGRPFGFVMESGPTEVRELDPRMFDPQGRIDIPRLFVGDAVGTRGVTVDAEFVERWRRPR